MAGFPADFQFANWQPRRERALPSFLVSLAMHAGVVAAIWTINPRASFRQFKAPTITQIMVEGNRQVTWYAPKAEMPAVSPVEQPTEETVAATPRYEAPQPMRATAPDAASERQLIVGDAPEIRLQQDQELPNMLSWQLPLVERPRFQLIAPRLQPPPRPRRIERPPEPPPKIETAPNAGLDISRFQQIARLRYQARELEQAAPEQRPIAPEPPPQVAATPTAPEVNASQLEQLSRLRFQRQQEQRQAPVQRAVEAPEAPKIEAQAGPGVDASRFSELSRLRYQQREQQREAPQRRTLSAEGAPVLQDAPGQAGLDAAQFQELSRLRYQAGDRGQPKEAPSRQALGSVAEAPAPEIGGGPAGAASVETAALNELPRLRYQSSTQGAASGPSPSARALGESAGESAPPVGGPGEAPGLAEIANLDLPGAPPPSLGAPSGDQAGGTSGQVNMVVASVNPADRAPTELPRGSRSGAFSAGPNATQNGGRTAPNGSTTDGLRTPNLSIDGPPSRATAEPADSAAALRSLTRSGGFEQLRPGEAPKIEARAEKPPIDPEMPFAGRPVYTLAINMPNLTSYRGDWVIQFAEALTEEQRRHETEEERAARLSKKDGSITPPYPVIKVDPKYIPDAVREKVEGEVVLYCVILETGAMIDLQLVEGLDKRLDASAREAFEKWKFEPARKKGAPIAVETLIRIPFRLNPDIKVRY